MNFLYEHYTGLADLSIWGYVIVTLLWMHATMMCVTLYYHRDQAHRAVDLHPVVRHICRFWLWLNTGSSTREWVAVHRRHHAHCEKEGDPHSPRLFGLKKVLLEGAELYRAAAHDPETVEKYAKGTPNDWLENNVYAHPERSYLGPWVLLAIDLVLFGVPGIIMLALQLANMPVTAAGIINGLCHAKGYRNFETDDASTNLWPIGLFVAGEELHNNHHAFPTSAKFSMRRHEVDMGWLHLKVLAMLGLAKIRRVANPPELAVESSATPDLDELRAIIVNRMHVLRHFTYNVTLPVLRRELESLGENANSLVRAARRYLSWQPEMLDEPSRQKLAEIVQRHPRLQTVLKFRSELKQLWEGAHTSNERLLTEFREWCARAEQSGIQGMQEFVAYLKSFPAMREPARFP
ncbi:MAG TPA: fatty acid desaturase [Gammaproteobacteria bacterium]|nr:fatty acid desaturase [Gammaproteobacteria bacterium]